MNKPGAGALIFGFCAAAVVFISVGLDVRRSALMKTAADLPRFSGSAVVAKLPSLLPPAQLPTRLRVVVVRDEAAASYYDSPATLDSIVEAWRVELAAIGADVSVVRSSALPTEPAAHVLVIPSSPCMTIETREAIDGAAARGQGLILTGLAGVYDAGCRRIGLGLIVEATGATRAEVLEERAMVYVVLPTGSPLSADLPPGARIELNPARQVAVRKRGRDAYYSDYALQPEPADSMPLVDGAVVRGGRGNGRIVYWGFELRNVIPREWNRSVVRLLVRNSVAWVSRAPLGWVEPWPRGRRAAAVFAQDVEYEYTNARFALDSLRAVGVPGTFFLTSKYASHYRRLTRQLAEGGEIASHTETHQRLGGAPRDVQYARLVTTQRDLISVLGQRVAGLRPPEEQFDSATMAAWLAAGGTYLFGVNDSRAAAPELLRIGDDTLVLFSRVGDDDLALAASGETFDTLRYTTQFLNDLAQMRALGGLFVFSYHSQLLARPELVPVLARVARAAVADPAIWSTTSGEIATWWRTRAELRVQLRGRGPNALEVIVRNRSGHSIDAAVVPILLPDTRRVLGASTALLPSEAGVLRLALPVIAGFSTRSFTVQLEPIKLPVEPKRPRVEPRRRVEPRFRVEPRKAAWWKFWKWRQR